ncbi:11098_t:CDS:2, partial [Scutellospora calospora]
ATPPLVGWGMMDSIMLGSLHNYRLLLQGNDPTVKLNVFQHALAGAGAGFTVSFVATPIEQIKVH